MKKIFPLVRSKKIATLSSPQRQIRKNVEQNRRDRDSSDEGDQEDVKKIEKRKSKHSNNACVGRILFNGGERVCLVNISVNGSNNIYWR